MTDKTANKSLLKGVVYDSPIEGLEYNTQSRNGITNRHGEFRYYLGETVTFSIGGLVLGSAITKSFLTPADLVITVAGDVKKIKTARLINIARFLQSFARDKNIENGILITEIIRQTVSKYQYDINFSLTANNFALQTSIEKLFSELNISLKDAVQAKNHLRRSMYGIRKFTDVKIPTRDGAYVLCDIYRPVKSGKYPAILAFGGYGKAWLNGHIASEKDLVNHELAEDNYFESNPLNMPWENHETANTVDWVPKGYAIVKIDERGSNNTPGEFNQFGWQESLDYYDSVEWVARQPWSNGKVGAWGVSYWAMTQWNMAEQQPPSLKAMVPIFGSNDPFRGYGFNGGLFNYFNRVIKNVNGVWRGVEWTDIARANPFDDPELYGENGAICHQADLSKIITPFYDVMPLEHPGIHIRDASEAFIRAPSKNKKLAIIGDYMGAWPYSTEALSEFSDFFDYWLKGKKNQIMRAPRVKMMVRTGGGGFFWYHSIDWPVPDTEYRKYYLDAAASSWDGDSLRHDFMKLTSNLPEVNNKKTYSAEVNLGNFPPHNPAAPPPRMKRNGGDPGWSHGVSFVTEPLLKDMFIAGYIKLVLWVSSTSTDLDIIADIRVFDENNKEICYNMSSMYPESPHYPVTIGWQKVSHRKLDLEKSTVYRPWHTHRREDYQPLKANEIVPVEVEIWPTTAFIRKGHRIRLDVQPTDGWDHPVYHEYNESYHKGALNTIYTGSDYLSYLQIPVIPRLNKY